MTDHKDNLNVQKQLRLLESLDSKSCEDAKQSLIMLVQHGKGIPQLVAYFCTNRSERALEILYKVADPYHIILLDTLKGMVRDKKLPEVVVLLAQIIQRQPSWVSQIVKHNLFTHIVTHLKTTKPIVVRDVISGMFFMSILLPLCTDVPTTPLQGFFHFFLHGCETLALLIAAEREDRTREKLDQNQREKLAKLIKDEVEPVHCGVALREYFQALYGIFPIQFVSFLKHYCNEKSEKKKSAVVHILMALMNGVRLHPHLILHTPEWEQSKLRYENKEDAAHFLDQIRQVAIGTIPVPVDFSDGEGSDAVSPSVEGQSSKGYTFTFPALEHDSASSTGVAWMDESADLLDMINTPGGSRPGSPSRKPASETNSPIVLTSEPRSRKPSGESGVRTTRFGSISNSISTMLKRGERKSVAAPENALIEIERGNETGRRDSQADSDNLFDEAEDALDDLPTHGIKELADRQKFYDMAPSSSNAESVQTPEKETLSPIPSEEISRRPTAEDIVDEAKQTAANLLEAAKAARRAVQERKRQMAEAELESPLASIRSRSASLKPLQMGHASDRGRTCTMDAGFLQNAGDSDSGEQNAPDSTDGRSRFSVTSYFNKLNRQRFVSECPQRVEIPISEQIPLSGRQRTLERTFSCPDLSQDEPASTARRLINQIPEEPKSQNFFDRFPYLKRYQPLDLSYLHQLEERFAARQEKKLDLYMGASRVYHSCLKDLGLADRLPGRIYDDMSHITEGLPLDKQRDMLRARLQLVNQHLMYERSCRLLHALRNRRLFVQITGENSLKSQLHSERQKNFTIREEVESLRKGLTAKRREMIEMKNAHQRREYEMTAEYKKLRMEAYKKDTQFSELQHIHQTLERRERESRLNLEKHLRRADDLEVAVKRHEGELVVMKDRQSELRRCHEDNAALKDQILALEQCADRLRAPDIEEKQKQALYAELDKVTRERESERLSKEELKEKNTGLEHDLRTEQARAEKFVSDLARSAKILREQNEAAEQRFLTLQLVNEQHLELINELHVQLETAKDAEAAFKANFKSHDSHEVPSEPIPPLLGTTTTEPSRTFYPARNNVVEEQLFEFDEDRNLSMDL